MYFVSTAAFARTYGAKQCNEYLVCFVYIYTRNGIIYISNDQINRAIQRLIVTSFKEDFITFRKTGNLQPSLD